MHERRIEILKYQLLCKSKSQSHRPNTFCTIILVFFFFTNFFVYSFWRSPHTFLTSFTNKPSHKKTTSLNNKMPPAKPQLCSPIDCSKNRFFVTYLEHTGTYCGPKPSRIKAIDHKGPHKGLYLLIQTHSISSKCLYLAA